MLTLAVIITLDLFLGLGLNAASSILVLHAAFADLELGRLTFASNADLAVGELAEWAAYLTHCNKFDIAFLAMVQGSSRDSKPKGKGCKCVSHCHGRKSGRDV
jgi:hypothetical protein